MTNSSNFGSSDPLKNDSKYAPQDDPVIVDATEDDVNPVDILKEKRATREESKPVIDADHPIKLEEPRFKETPAPNQGDEFQEEQSEEKTENKKRETPRRKKSSYIFALLLVLLLGGIGVAAYKIVDQEKNRPDSLRKELTILEEEFEIRKTNLKELANTANRLTEEEVSHARLSLARQKIVDAESLLAKQDELQASLIQQIMAKQEEMLAYYKRYKAYTQQMARGMYISELQTKSGRLFHDVTITRCTPSEISFTHSSGATRVQASDLPDPVMDRLAYTNPFSDVESLLRETKSALNKVTRTTAPSPAPPVAPQPIPLPDNPSGLAPVAPVDQNTSDNKSLPDTSLPPVIGDDEADIPFELPPAL